MDLAHVSLKQVGELLVVSVKVPHDLTIKPALEGVTDSRPEQRHHSCDDDAGAYVPNPSPDRPGKGHEVPQVVGPMHEVVEEPEPAHARCLNLVLLASHSSAMSPSTVPSTAAAPSARRIMPDVSPTP